MSSASMEMLRAADDWVRVIFRDGILTPSQAAAWKRLVHAREAAVALAYDRRQQKGADAMTDFTPFLEETQRYRKVEEIRQRFEAITPGPWEAAHRHSRATATDDEMGGLGWDIEGPPEPMLRGMFSRAADAQFIAHAPEDIGTLLGIIDGMRAS